jgi:hypothetical protein
MPLSKTFGFDSIASASDARQEAFCAGADGQCAWPFVWFDDEAAF